MTKFALRRTISSDLTLLLSVITTVFAVVIGVFYYVYSSRSVTEKLISASERTAVEMSEVLVLPLYNYDAVSASRIADVYLASGRVNGVQIQAPDMGTIFDNTGRVKTSLPAIEKKIVKDGIGLGLLRLSFDDSPILSAQKRAVWTTLVAVIITISIYIFSLRVILTRILISPLSNLVDRLQEISSGSYEGHMESVPQTDLNEIVTVANRMSDEIDKRTRILAENERNYRTVYNSTSDAIFIHDASDGTIVDVNEAMVDMYGYDRREAMLLQVADLSLGEPPYSQAEAEEFVRKAITSGPQVFKWRARRKDGSLFWVEVAMKKSRVNDIDIVLAAVRDISERTELEEQLRQAQKMEAIGTLAGGVAHDFNNLLTSILGFTELSLISTEPGSNLHKDLKQVEKASNRARELVQQILTFSRKQKQVMEVLQLEPVVREAFKLLRSTIPSSVDIGLEIESKARIFGDQSQVIQLIMNLCTNGYQALPESSGRLAISLKDVPTGTLEGIVNLGLEPGSYVVLEVSDNGTGMDEETKSKIFEPYFTTKDKGKGTGLGMSTVYGIVKGHHGHITVESEVGAGSTFRIYLPVTMEEPSRKAGAMTGEIPRMDKRVMVVDDEEEIRALMVRILSYGGCRVDCYDCGSAAWRAFSDDPGAWDLLLTDQSMPGMTGVELSRKVLRLRPDMPIILCSGYSDAIDSDKVREMGIRAFLQKPVTLRRMLSTAHEALSGQSEAT